MALEGDQEHLDPPSRAVTDAALLEPDPNPEDGTASGNSDARAQPSNGKDALVSYDWDQLQREYAAAMQAVNQEERAAFTEFDAWIKVFEAWAATATTHENERSCKRLNTRVAHVQLSETRLEKKRQHYTKVLDAFRGALEMLD